MSNSHRSHATTFSPSRRRGGARILLAALAALAFLLSAPVPGLARPGEMDEPSERFHQRMSWRPGADGLTLEARPSYLYVVGNAESLAWYSSAAAGSAPAVAVPAAVYEVEPVTGLVEQKCQDALCLPSCRDHLCPPPPLPLVWRTSGASAEDDLRWTLAEERVTLLSQSREAHFLVVSGPVARGAGEELILAPGQTLTVDLPVAVYRWSCVGAFVPQFRPAAELAGGCSLAPCAAAPLAGGLCAVGER